MDKIQKFTTDTVQDRKNRIAVVYDTLPSLLTDQNESLEKIIKNPKTTSFEQILKIKGKETSDDLLVNLWLFYKKEGSVEHIEDYPNLRSILKKNSIRLQDYDFQTFMNTIRVFEKKLDEDKKKHKKLVEYTDKNIHTVMENTVEQKHTPFHEESYHIYFFITNMTGISLSYFFDQLCCNEKIPYCSYQSICKIYKNYQDTSSPTLVDPNTILLKIQMSPDKYLDSIISIDEKTRQFRIEVSVNTNTPIDMKEYIQSICTHPIVFSDTFDKHDIDGTFIYPSQRFNKYILSDMIMNLSIMNRFLSVDESVKASTKKTGLLTKCKGGMDKYGNDIDASCNIICKKVIDGSMKGNFFPIGSYYVKVRVTRFRNTEHINTLMFYLSKFLTIYHEKETEILKEYQSFLGKTFTIEEDDIENETQTIEERVPDLFISGYTRWCDEERHPIIATEEEIVKNEWKEGTDYIRFPKDSDEPFCYRCSGETFPNIGLQVNKLSNREQYYYIPCCFKGRRGNNNNIDIYYHNKEKKLKQQQNIISTLDRILDEGYFGILPDNLDMFMFSLYSADNTYFRKGVTKTKHSFLECVKKATGKDHPITRFMIASQENPDLQLDQLEALFNDKTVYMDPRRWIRLLEHVYQCNIHVFALHGKSKQAKVVIPYHNGPLLQYTPVYKQTVLIIEVQNSVTKDTACELIVTKEQMIFEDDHIGDLIQQFYLLPDGRKPVIVYQKNPQVVYQEFIFTHQVLDSYKKLRGLVTTTKLYLTCDPLPPLDLPILETPPVNTLTNITKVLGKEIYNYGIFKLPLAPTTDIIETYRLNRSTATVLGECFIYMYSRYCSKEKKLIDSMTTIRDFVHDYVDQTLVTKYMLLPSSLIDNKILKKSGYLSPDEKLIVYDKEILSRLICLLRLRIINAIKEVRHYHQSKEFLHFYNHLDNYHSYDNIIMYTDSIKSIQNIDPIVYNDFQHKTPYYLRLTNVIFMVISFPVEDIKENRRVYNKNFEIIEDSNKAEQTLIRYDDYVIDKEQKKEKVTLHQRMILL